jgi:hypothetical protein
MKKLVCILMCVSLFGLAEADTNPDHVKLGVGLAVTLFGAVGTGVCIYQVSKLNKLIKEQNYLSDVYRDSRYKYIMAALGFGALTVAGGAYSAYKGYDLISCQNDDSKKKPKDDKTKETGDDKGIVFSDKEEALLKKWTDKSDMSILDNFSSGVLSVEKLNDEIEKLGLSSGQKLALKKGILAEWKNGSAKDWKHKGTYLDVKEQTLERIVNDFSMVVKNDETLHLALVKKKAERLAEVAKKEAIDKALVEHENFDKRFLCKDPKILGDLALKEINDIKFVKKALENGSVKEEAKIEKIATVLEIADKGSDPAVYTERAKRILNWHKNVK